MEHLEETVEVFRSSHSGQRRILDDSSHPVWLLEIDERIISLVDHDRRLQFFEETKALAIKLSYKIDFGKKKSQEIPTPSSSAPAAKKSCEKGPCEHFDSARHDKKSCHFLFHADERPSG